MRNRVVLFDLIFWLAAAPILVSTLASIWNTRPIVLRTTAAATILVIILWHLCLLYQKHLRPRIYLVPTVLSVPQEGISILMGVVLALAGFYSPRTPNSILMGLIGVLIIQGHARKLAGSACYYMC